MQLVSFCKVSTSKQGYAQCAEVVGRDRGAIGFRQIVQLRRWLMPLNEYGLSWRADAPAWQASDCPDGLDAWTLPEAFHQFVQRNMGTRVCWAGPSSESSILEINLRRQYMLRIETAIHPSQAREAPQHQPSTNQ